jgi:hypothetical protein
VRLLAAGSVWWWWVVYAARCRICRPPPPPPPTDEACTRTRPKRAKTQRDLVSRCVYRFAGLKGMNGQSSSSNVDDGDDDGGALHGDRCRLGPHHGAPRPY